MKTSNRRIISVALLAVATGTVLAQEPRTSVRTDEAASRESDDRSDDATEIAPITVTGTRIRGGQTPSPVLTIGSENIREEGFSDLGDVIRAVPRNFTGGQNPGVPSLGYSGAGMQNQNVTGGSALNLRGLGPDATLTLLNGRRMAYGGMTQAVDIDAIPTEAVDRIEIVADGASAIYGSDAVGGVGNVILRRNYDGVTVGATAGRATAGGMGSRGYNATAGTSWTSGSVLATFKSTTTDPIHARQRDYTRHIAHPATIYPGSDLDSGLVSLGQMLGPNVEVRVDALRTRRDQLYNLFSPDGRINRVNSETTTSLASPGLELFLPGDWTVTLATSRAKSEHLQFQHWQVLQTGELTPSVHDCLCNESRVHEAGAEGPVFDLPGGEARMAAGVGHRTNDYLHFNHLRGTATTEGSESSRYGYAELSLPVIKGPPGQGKGPRLTLTAAVRGEDYDSFGSVTVPKAGAVFRATDSVTLKGSWGRSFKAPTLHQRFFAPYVMLTAPGYFGGSGYPHGSTVLAAGGGNRDLEAERARTSSVSVAYHPTALPGLDLELTWYDIDYTGRALEPITNFAEALANPAYEQFIEDLPPADVQAARIAAASVFYNFTGAAYDPASVVALVNLQYTNVARQKIRGLDLSGSYRMEAGPGSLTLRGSASWLDSTQQNTGLLPSFDLAGTLHNPPRVHARTGLVWSSGSLTASTFANYKAGLEDVVRGEETGSHTTFDVALALAPERIGGFLSGVELSLAMHNVLDREPPRSTAWLPGSSLPYDATNYSPVGRSLSVGLSKRW